jgi:PIN domain nuclease of toxin-antitoxin system
VWLSLEPKKLSRRASNAIREARAGTGVAVASITLFELAWLAENGRIRVSGSVESFVRECAAKVIVRPITPEIAAFAVQLPASYPKDPQDRIIAATAVVEGLSLITADKRMRASRAVNTIW